MTSFGTTNGARSNGPFNAPSREGWRQIGRGRGQLRGILQLVAGLMCCAFVLAAFVCAGLTVGNVLPSADGVLALLACLHGALFTGQFAQDGNWLPRRWNLLFWCLLSPANLLSAAMMFRAGHGSDGLAAAMLFLLSVAVQVKAARKTTTGPGA